MKKLRIGITIALKSADESLWTNGMKLNILYLARLLKNSNNNYEISILNSTDIDLSNKSKHFNEFNIVSFKENYKDIDLLICMGSQVEKEYMQYFQNHKDKKVVGYRCGNNYILSIEEVLFNGLSNPKFAWAGVYTPNYPLHVQGKEQLSPHTYLGWNGVWRLDYTVPIYTWIHQIESLGWIYD
jgi:hypothetical protein